VLHSTETVADRKTLQGHIYEECALLLTSTNQMQRLAGIINMAGYITLWI